MSILAHSYEETVHLTPDQHVNLFVIAHKMKKAGLSSTFISSAIRTALEYEGVADLVFMWSKESDRNERDEIIADIQDLIDDCHKASTETYTIIRMNDLDKIRDNIRVFKDGLLKIVNENGGISVIAKITGIPQPSLSRFFNSNAMPRRQTLLKIAAILPSDAIKIKDFKEIT